MAGGVGARIVAVRGVAVMDTEAECTAAFWRIRIGRACHRADARAGNTERCRGFQESAPTCIAEAYEAIVTVEFCHRVPPIELFSGSFFARYL